jgi:hypothetical protein
VAPAEKDAPPEAEKTQNSQSAGQAGSDKLRSMQSQMQGGDSGGGRRGAANQKKEEAVQSNNFKSLANAGLKSMIDRLEARKPVLSVAVDLQPAQKRVSVLGLNPLKLKTIIDPAGILGACLESHKGAVITMAVDYPSEDSARKRLDTWEGTFGTEVAAALADLLKSKIEFAKQEAAQGAGGRGGMMGGGLVNNRMAGEGGEGGGAPSAPPSGGARQGTGGGGMMGMSAAQQQQRMAGAGGPGGGMQRMMQMMGQQGTGGAGGGGQQNASREKFDGSIKVDYLPRTLLVLTIDLSEEGPNTKLMDTYAKPLVLRQKGYLDMKDTPNPVHALGKAGQSYVEVHGRKFPRGTANREAPSSRYGRPYPPDTRVSFFAELLPFLGPEPAAIQKQINSAKSWRDPDNLNAASSLIPQLLDPSTPANTWWVRLPKLGRDVATTQYVGIAGIGLDAAEYKADDPAVVAKRGIFGYDRTTRLEDIKDGAANTIMLAQVPPTFKRPWLAGGGSTVMGVPEKGSVKPFVSGRYQGKAGTHVIMADGSVRFISENVSDEVFQALCTINGGERVILQRDAPAIPEPKVEPKPAPKPPDAAAPAPDKDKAADKDKKADD